MMGLHSFIVNVVFVAGIVGTVANSNVLAAIRHQTFTYKKVGHLEIQVEVTRDSDDKKRPVLVWIHGGAFMKGARFDKWSNPFQKMMLDAGYIIASIDYRLAPESKLPAIIEDVIDACDWVRQEGEALFDADVERLAVAGASAGGFLTLAVGSHVKPAPTAIASFYGYCDMTGTWATRPSSDPEHHETHMSAEEFARFKLGPPVSNKYERTYDITPYYNHLRQIARWPHVVTGWDPLTEKDKYKTLLPYFRVTKEFPPTIMVHGTDDLDVDYKQSVQMSKSLKAAGVRYDLILLEGAKHGFRGIDPGIVENAHRKAMAFVRHYMED